MAGMTPARQLDLLRRASAHWLATLTMLTDEEYAAPSLLPGWTRAHVVAHVALNAEALAGALRGVASGHPVPMYPSSEARDADIAALVATASPTELRERNRAAIDDFELAETALIGDPSEASIERIPGGPRFTVESCIGRRLCEVEIHHADLGLTWTSADWAPEFAEWVVEERAGRLPHVALRAVDTGRAWSTPDAAVEVSGSTAALAWWLTGRGEGEGLTSNTGVLPQGPTY